eukprot:s1807_g16.t1
MAAAAWSCLIAKLASCMGASPNFAPASLSRNAILRSTRQPKGTERPLAIQTSGWAWWLLPVFVEALQPVRQGKAGGPQGTQSLREKLLKAKFCLAEALRIQSRLRLLDCNCLTLRCFKGEEEHLAGQLLESDAYKTVDAATFGARRGDGVMEAMEVDTASFKRAEAQLQSKRRRERLDLDLAHLGGHLQWVEPALPQRVYSYVVYLAESAFGDQRSQVGNEVTVGRHQLLVPAETQRESYTHFAA